MITQLYFAVAIRESARHLSGNKDYSSAGEERESVLDSRDDSSPAMDIVGCAIKPEDKQRLLGVFYFEFAARKERATTSMLGSLLK